VTSGTSQSSGSYAAVPASGDSRSISTNVCYNIIDSVFPSFSDQCSVLPQTTFSLPNFFGHQTKQDAADLLSSFAPALQSKCFSHIRMFTCPLFFPPCDGEPILPCASFCRGKKFYFNHVQYLNKFFFLVIAVLNRCGGFDLSAISCDKLPEKSEFCPCKYC
jgi:hypothetical protein